MRYPKLFEHFFGLQLRDIHMSDVRWKTSEYISLHAIAKVAMIGLLFFFCFFAVLVESYISDVIGA